MTASEVEVYHLIIKGFSSKDIGEILGITEKTVKWHITKIFKNRLVTSRAELLAKVLKEKDAEILALKNELKKRS